MNKRSHKNTGRLTAKERAETVIRAFIDTRGKGESLVVFIQRSPQAHARAALRRNRR